MPSEADAVASTPLVSIPTRGPGIADPTWAVLVAALLIAVAVGLGIDRLHAYATHNEWETSVLIQIEGLVYRLHPLEGQALQQPHTELSAGERAWAAERTADLVAARSELDNALTELKQIDPEDARIIGAAFAQYLTPVEELARLVATGQDEAALRVHQTRVDPAFAALRAVVNGEREGHRVTADRADLLARGGTLVSLLLGALAIGLLFRRSQRANAAAARLEGEQRGQRAREQELRAALAVAETANQTTRQFLTMMSHELRTPMQAVMGYAELLLAGPAGSLTLEQTEDVQTIHRGAQRLVALVQQMLDISRLDAGQFALKSEPVTLAEIIDQVLQDVAPQAATKALTLRIDLPADLPPVMGDAMGIHQILLNLVGNAVKFTEAGEVRISAETRDGEIAVLVGDTGIGIAADDLPSIFEEFHQAEAGLVRRYEGAGLGLAIARKLAELMGGRLTVESQPGCGSIFTLHLMSAETSVSPARMGTDH